MIKQFIYFTAKIIYWVVKAIFGFIAIVFAVFFAMVLFIVALPTGVYYQTKKRLLRASQ